MSIYDINRLGNLVKENAYPGRGIAVGETQNGEYAAFAYFIMGRSENSRNRVFEENGDEVTIYPYDSSKVSDPSLIIYSPVRKYADSIIVTNGDQTDTVYEFLKDGKTFEEALETREFEPDKPNFTPRISALLKLKNNGFVYKMSILKSEDADGTQCARYTYSYNPLQGLGHFIHTYNCDGNPIPTFTGEPRRITIPDSIDEFTDEIWNNLNEDNKVSLYTRYINLKSGETENRLINKNNGGRK